MITINIYKDNKVVKTFENEYSDFCALKWLLNHQSNSTDWALKYEGYKVEIIDQETKEIEFWKHSGQI